MPARGSGPQAVPGHRHPRSAGRGPGGRRERPGPRRRPPPPGCDRREDEYDWKPGAGDGTERCHDCRKEADDTREHNALLAARRANAAMHPCHTCQGSIGGKPDSIAELHKPADPCRLECPDRDYNRHANGRPPIILALPTNRDRSRAAAGRLDDPYWHIRLHHAKEYPNR